MTYHEFTASGMGLAVAKALSARNEWAVHIFDLNASAGESAVSTLNNATFHRTNVADYASLAASFKAAFQSQRRIDFVFANAGIAEKTSFYADQQTDGDEPPGPPKEGMLIVDICLTGVITTTWLAQHYFRLSPPGGDRNLVMTASCGGLYPSYYSCTYSAAKHGVVGMMRSIAPQFWRALGVRVNAICPGTVKTNLLSMAEWGNFPEEYFTPVEKIVQVVMMLVDGKDGSEKGREVGVMMGKAVEISGRNHYYREQPEYCDEGMRAVMASTDVAELKH